MRIKKKLLDRCRSLEVLRIMRRQEIERWFGRVTPIPDWVMECVLEAKERVEAGLTKLITFEEFDRKLGIIRYGKRGKPYYKPRRNGRKALH